MRAGPTGTGSRTRPRSSSRSPCCVGTGAATAPSPSPPPASQSPYMSPDEVLAVARAGAAAGCHEALFTLGEAPEERYPVARSLARRPRLRLDRRLPGGHVRAGARRDRAPPPRQRRRARLRRPRPPAPRLGQPGDDARVARPRPGLSPGCARQDPGATPGHVGRGGRARHPLHHRRPRRASASPAHERVARLAGHRRLAPRATDTSRR